MIARLIAAIVTAALAALCSATTTAVDNRPPDAAVIAFDAPAADRAALAALASMQDPGTGLWPIAGISAWWSSANDLTALVDAERALGTHQYDALIARTYALDRDYTGPDFRNNGPDFHNHYYDDTAWWGLAWLDAYRWTGDRRYLATAQDDDAYVHAARSTICGAGVRWAEPIIRNSDQLNAITNELAMQLAAELGRRTEALTDWVWLRQSGLISRDGLVRDHLDAACRPTGPAWTYNQGTLSAALTALAQATGVPSYSATARRLADAATTSAQLNPGGVLADPCEAPGLCGVDGSVFKGADVRGLGQLNAALPDHPYTPYLVRQARAAYRGDRLAGDRYGPHWAGAAPWSNPASQGSAVDLLTAVAEF